MIIIPYKDFSLKFHIKNRQNRIPNVCQFELTFGCGLHCKHCYTDCYNQGRYIQRELNTEEVKQILDKVYREGVLWLCFTGGDPLTREDFLDLYTYARDKGFIITIFTNAYSMSERIAGHLKDRVPFVIEITLNAITQDVYERISQVKGSFVKAMNGIDLILKAKLPLKIKTQVTKDNLEELPRIKQFIEKLGLKFHPTPLLNSCLNGDSTPANLRISPQEALSLNGDTELSIDEHEMSTKVIDHRSKAKLFACAVVGTSELYIDPYGNLIPCGCIRQPGVNLLKADIGSARNNIASWIKKIHSAGGSPCSDCSLKSICLNCPGRALLESRDLKGRLGWFCELALLAHGHKAIPPVGAKV